MADLAWHVEATRDLDAIAEFIARSSLVSSVQFVTRIVSVAEHLRSHPELGRVVPEIDQKSYREIIFQNYRIVYRLFGERVVILGVVHAAMDLDRQIEKRAWDLT